MLERIEPLLTLLNRHGRQHGWLCCIVDNDAAIGKLPNKKSSVANYQTILDVKYWKGTIQEGEALDEWFGALLGEAETILARPERRRNRSQPWHELPRNEEWWPEKPLISLVQQRPLDQWSKKVAHIDKEKTELIEPGIRPTYPKAWRSRNHLGSRNLVFLEPKILIALAHYSYDQWRR